MYDKVELESDIDYLKRHGLRDNMQEVEAFILRIIRQSGGRF